MVELRGMDHLTDAELAEMGKNLARTDIRISQLHLAILFGGLFFVSHDWFWYWFIPAAALYVRMHYLVMKREEALAEEMSMRERGLRTARNDARQSSVPVANRSEQIGIMRQ